jgi:hypothetical protein
MHSFEVSLGMKALIELHFQHEELPRFIENVLRSTLSYPNETSKECIQFLNNTCTTYSFVKCCTLLYFYMNTVKPGHAVTSIKRSPFSRPVIENFR